MRLFLLPTSYFLLQCLTKSRNFLIALLLTLLLAAPAYSASDPSPVPEKYKIGINDILEIIILQPEQLGMEYTVALDGYISFPYIGSVLAEGRTVEEIQHEIETRLADGYLKYPVVLVTLKISLSKQFFVHGEVAKPGAYPLTENMSVFKAISLAGGFTKFGSSNKVKVMREKKDGPGYKVMKVNVGDIMDGKNDADINVEPGDIVVVSEGVF